MNWVLFGLLWGASLFLKWLSEHPDSLGERLFIGLVYTAVCAVVGMVVPAEHTAMGLTIFTVTMAGDITLKIYRHFAMVNLEKKYGPAPR